jgi:hypothetical protein
MFGVNWSDPQTLWLNMTNLGLGLITLIAVAAVGYGIVWDLILKWRESARVDGEVSQMLAGMQHAFHSPELGLTMADGGEPETKPKRPAKPGKRTR